MDQAESCILEYLYRDASNYKQFAQIRVLGAYESRDEARLRTTLWDDDMFIPEQVGMKPLQGRFAEYGPVPSQDDHVWHELLEYRSADPVVDAAIPIFGTKESLLQAFESVKRWDIYESRLFHGLSFD